MAESIFTTQTPVNGNMSDGSGLTTATAFTPAVDGVVTHVRFFSSVTISGTYTGGLWEAVTDDSPEGTGTGAELGTAVMSGSPTSAGWNLIPFTTPIPVEAGKVYKVGLHNSDGRFVQTSNFPEFQGGGGGITSGNLYANENAQDMGFGPISQGNYQDGATPLYPNQTFNASNYFVDVVFESSVPANEGAAAFSLDLALAATGDAPEIVPNEGTAGFGLVLTLSGTGQTPAIAPNEGAAAFGLGLAVSGTGDAPDVPPNTGAAAFGLALTVAGAGDAPEIPPNSGAAAFGLVLTAAGTGDAPDVPPNSGAAAFGLVLTAAASGERPGVPANTGSAGLDLVLALSATGETPAPSPNSGVAAFSIALAVAGAGDAPEIPPNSGAAAFGLRLALAGAGSDGGVGCPVPAFPFTPRAVKSFPGGDCT